MNGRGQYGRQSGFAPTPVYPRRVTFGTPYVGLKLIHTPGDSDRAVRQIDVEMQAIVDAMYRAMGTDPSVIRRYSLDQASKLSPAEMAAWKEEVLAAKAKATQSPLWIFFEQAVSPTYNDWMKFRDVDNEYYGVFTSWEEYENWLSKARQLREAVTSKGVDLTTPVPQDLTKTLPGEALDAAGGAVKDAFKILKWTAIGVLGIGALFALGSLGSSLKKGKDPVDALRGRS